MAGYEKIPEVWKSGIPAIADKKFQFTNFSFHEICKSTLDRALKLIRRAGGQVSGDGVLIPYQEPRAPRLEQWEPGIPDKRIACNDPAWSWKGGWTVEKSRGDEAVGKTAEGGGAEAALSFTGAAVILVGNCSQSGGKADVFVDGKKAGEINAYIVERTSDSGLWHTYGLKQGPHTLRIVSRDAADSRSKGKRITISAAVIFRK